MEIEYTWSDNHRVLTIEQTEGFQCTMQINFDRCLCEVLQKAFYMEGDLCGVNHKPYDQKPAVRKLYLVSDNAYCNHPMPSFHESMLSLLAATIEVMEGNSERLLVNPRKAQQTIGRNLKEGSKFLRTIESEIRESISQYHVWEVDDWAIQRRPMPLCDWEKNDGDIFIEMLSKPFIKLPSMDHWHGNYHKLGESYYKISAFNALTIVENSDEYCVVDMDLGGTPILYCTPSEADARETLDHIVEILSELHLKENPRHNLA